MSTVRASWWSVTINNPTELDRQTVHGPAPRWVRIIKGQDEIGESGTLHLQMALNTAQVRMSQVKQWLPRAHIEAARNANALANYVSKDKTAVANSQFEHNYYDTNSQSMPDVLMLIAEVANTELTAKRMAVNVDTGKVDMKKEEAYKQEFWDAVAIVVGNNENLIQTLTMPSYEKAWVKTRNVWLLKVQVDRQTELSLAGPTGYGSEQNIFVPL